MRIGDINNIDIDYSPDVKVNQAISLDGVISDKSAGLVISAAKYEKTNGGICHQPEYGKNYEPRLAITIITDLAVSLKSSPKSSLVWVSSMKTGKPVEGAKVTLRDLDNSMLDEGMTNSKGIYEGKGVNDLFTDPDGFVDYYAVVEYNGDFSLVKSNWTDGLQSNKWRFSSYRKANEWNQGLTGHVIADRDIYRPGEKALFKIVCRNRDGGMLSIPPNEVFEYKIYDADDTEVAKGDISFNEFGTAIVDHQLKDVSSLGTYKLNVFKKNAQAEKENIENEESEENYWEDYWYSDGYYYGKRDPNAPFVDFQFSVVEYRAPDFEIEITTDKDEYVFTEQIRSQIHASYLFGGAMSNCNSKINVHRYSFTQSFPEKHPDYTFGEINYAWDNWTRSAPHVSSNVITDEVTLNHSGEYSHVLDLTTVESPLSYTYNYEITVSDENTQTVSKRISKKVHRGYFYIGLDTDEYFFRSGKDANVNVITTDIHGNIVTGKPISLELIHRTYKSANEHTASNTYRRRWEKVEKVVQIANAITGSDPVTITFNPEETGTYVVRAKSKDRAGNPIQTSIFRYVSGSQYTYWQNDDSDVIDIVPDKDKYSPGDTAKLMIKNPFGTAECSALITKERYGITIQDVTSFTSSSEIIELTLSEADIPDVHLSVVLFQERTAMPDPQTDSSGDVMDNSYMYSSDSDYWGRDEDWANKDTGKPKMKMGMVHLHVSPKDKRLDIKVSANKENYKPGEKVSLNINVKDINGKGVESEVLVAAEDEAVLNLTGYQPPDLVDLFYATVGNAVSTSGNLMHLVDQRGKEEKGEDSGGGGGAESAEIRQNFITTAYWEPQLTTDGNGNLKTDFILPDNLTRFRVVAVAVSKKHAFGWGKTAVSVSKDLMIRPSIPRFVRLDDKFHAGAVIHNYSERDASVQVSLEAKGADIINRQGERLSIPSNSQKEMRWELVAKQLGTMDFTINANSNNAEDTAKFSIQSKFPVVTETVAMYNESEESVKQPFELSDNIRPEVGGLKVKVSSSALGDLEKGIEYLIDYPYGCLEQRTSRLLPLVFLNKFGKAFAIEELNENVSDKLVKSEVSKLSNYQHYSGGMGLWQSYNSWVSPYLTAYSMMVVHEAEKANLVGDKKIKDLLRKGNDFLRSVLGGNWKDNLNRIAELSVYEEAFLTWVLNLQGEDDNGFSQTLWEHYKDNPHDFDVFAKACLVLSMENNKDLFSNVLTKIKSDLMNSIRQDIGKAYFEEDPKERQYRPWYKPFTDNVKNSSIMLILLLKHGTSEEKKQIVPKLVKYLLSERQAHGGRWATTHQGGWALMSLARYYDTEENVVPDFEVLVEIAKTPILDESEFSGRDFSIAIGDMPMKQLLEHNNNPILWLKHGDGKMFISTHLDYAPKNPDTSPVNQGFMVNRQLIDLKNDDLPNNQIFDIQQESSFSRGNIVTAELVVNTPRDRHFVVIESPIPAGMEIIDQSLLTSERYVDEQDNDASDIYSNTYITRHENWDDQFVIICDYLPAGTHRFKYIMRANHSGEFINPPTKAHEMYSPEIFGRSAYTQIKVD